MTLRDLTPKQLNENVRRAERERKRYFKSYNLENRINTLSLQDLTSIWNAAFNAGFKAGLTIPRKEE